MSGLTLNNVKQVMESLIDYHDMPAFMDEWVFGIFYTPGIRKESVVREEQCELIRQQETFCEIKLTSIIKSAYLPKIDKRQSQWSDYDLLNLNERPGWNRRFENAFLFYMNKSRHVYIENDLDILYSYMCEMGEKSLQDMFFFQYSWKANGDIERKVDNVDSALRNLLQYAKPRIKDERISNR